MKYYIVGGAVRDMLMGKVPLEVDLAFEGSVEEFLLAEPMARQVGKSVHVCILHGKEYVPLHENNITSDLYHRDLTINALALDDNGLLYAHPQSLFDLKHGILRPTTSNTFFQDPARIYRLARFAATFPQFSVHKSALEQAKAVIEAQKHKDIPAERVGRELLKALQASSPSLFMEILQKMQALSPANGHWFYEFSLLSDLELTNLGKLLDSFNPIHQTINESKQHDLLILGRFMLLGYSLKCTQKNDATYYLCKRLALPLRYAKAASHFATTFQLAQNFTQLEHAEIITLLLKTHTLGMSSIYWQCLKHCTGRDLSHEALKILDIILEVRLPKFWQNKGKASGEKLYALRCAAVEKYTRKR